MLRIVILNLIIIVRFAGFNLVMTAILFVFSLVLERMASSPVEIPPPHMVDRAVGLIDRALPLPKVSSGSLKTYNILFH
uniref:YggT family protein n=1 Tax=Heterorhabditis bacteriophora TaxID=37862 RepID=A0A1I7XD00_HETBA